MTRHMTKLFLMFMLFSVMVQPAFGQDEIPPGSRVIITANRANLYAYPDETSLIVATPFQGYVDRLGPYPNEEGWAFLSDQVAYVRLEDSGLAVRTEELQQALLDAAALEIEADPENVDAWLRHGTILAHRQNYAAAIEDYTSAIEIDPNNYDAYSARAWTYRQINEFDSSIADYKQAMEQEDPGAFHLIGAGLSYHRAKILDEAEELYKQAIELYPDAYYAYNNLGVLYKDQENVVKALEYFDLADNVNNMGYFAHYNVYLIYKNRNDISSAISELNKAAELDPYNPNNYVNLANAYAFDFNDVESAFNYIDLALEIDPKSSRAYEIRALINAYTAGDSQQAAEDFQTSLKLDPYNTLALSRAGIFYARGGQFETALEYFDRQAELERSSGRFYLFKAQVYYGMGDYESTKSTIDQFFEVGESDSVSDVSVAFLILGMTALQEGDYDTATEHYQYAFLLTPEWTKNWFDYRGLRLIDSRIALAQYYIQAISNDPDEADNYLQLANILMEFGVWDEAVNYYQQYLALEHSPGLGELVTLIKSFK